MKIFCLFLVFVSAAGCGQIQNVHFTEKQLQNISELRADDYGNIYTTTADGLRFIKYNPAGIQQAELRFTVPYKIQSVQNPLNIMAFSQNAQQMNFYDRNLAITQVFSFREKFGFIQGAFAEDARIVWLVDGSSNKILLYDFAEQRILRANILYKTVDQLIDFIVYEKEAYLLFPDKLIKIHLVNDDFAEFSVEDARRLRRENDHIFVIARKDARILENQSLSKVFTCDDCTFVDKNSSAYFVVRANKLYLYPIKNVGKTVD